MPSQQGSQLHQVQGGVRRQQQSTMPSHQGSQHSHAPGRHAASSKRTQASSLQELRHFPCTRASAVSEARQPRAGARRVRLKQPQQRTRVQTASTASARHMHAHERSERSTQAGGRGQRRGKRTHATSAKHTQASSLQQRRRLQHVTYTHARAQRAEHASRGQRRGESTLLQPQQSTCKQQPAAASARHAICTHASTTSGARKPRPEARGEHTPCSLSKAHACVHADTSHQLRHVRSKPTSASSEHASRKPWAEVRRAHS